MITAILNVGGMVKGNRKTKGRKGKKGRRERKRIF